jgi:hypothetical protein
MNVQAFPILYKNLFPNFHPVQVIARIAKAAELAVVQVYLPTFLVAAHSCARRIHQHDEERGS